MVMNRVDTARPKERSSKAMRELTVAKCRDDVNSRRPATMLEPSEERTGGRRHSNRGFTLVEVIIALTLLVIVLLTAYKIFTNCLDTERAVERLTIPEKVGEGILTVMRRDISMAFFKGSTQSLNNQVFVGENIDGVQGGEDRLTFLSAVTPKPRVEEYDWEGIRNICVIQYFLQESDAIDGYQSYTLFRKESTEFAETGVLDSPGLNYMIYDKVHSLDITYFDGYEWLAEWDSAAWIEEQESLVAEQRELETGAGGIPRVSDPSGRRGTLGSSRTTRAGTSNVPGGGSTPGAGSTGGGGGFGATDDPYGMNQELPTSPIPSAVRVDLQVYAAIGRKAMEKNGEPIIKRFTTIIPLMAARRMKIEIPALEEMAAGAGGAGAGGIADATTFGGGFTGAGDGPGEGRGRGDGRGDGGRDLRSRLRERFGFNPPQGLGDRLRNEFGRGGGRGGGRGAGRLNGGSSQRISIPTGGGRGGGGGGSTSSFGGGRR